jgi:CRP-like cAMP-binding protein
MPGDGGRRRNMALSELEFLRSVPFFSDILSSGELKALAEGARRVEFDRGACLIEQGDEEGPMYVIVKGSVTVSVRDRGTERSVATLREGDIVGEMALLTGIPRAATVTAQSPVTALEIDRSDVQPLLVAEPNLFDRFADTLAKRQRELDDLYGPGIWPFSGRRHDDLAIIIRTYFAEPPQRKPS